MKFSLNIFAVFFVAISFFGLNVNSAEAAITLRAAGTYTSGTANITPAIPAAQVADDLMILIVGTKPYNGSNTISGPTGWTSLGSATDGTVAASSADLGSMKTEMFYKIATSDAETDPTVANTSNDVSGAVVMVFQKATSESWVTPVGAGGGDATAGTGFSVTAASNPGITSGDMLVGYAAIRSDAGTQSSITVTATSATMGSFTESPGTDLTTTSGFDMGMSGGYVSVSSGTASAAPVYASTLAASHTGSAFITRLRVAAGGSCSSAADGAWTTETTWGSGCTGVDINGDGVRVPSSADNVTILSGHDITSATGLNPVVNNLTINNSTPGTLDVTSTGTLTVYGNFTNNGTLSGTGALNLLGSSTTIDGSGTMSLTGLTTITGSKTVNSSAALNFAGAVTLSTSGITTNQGNITVTGVLTIGSGTTWDQDNGSTLTAGATGSAIVNTGTFTARTASETNTVNYNRAGTQTGAVVNYSNLTLSGSGVKTFSNFTSTKVYGTLSMEDTATITVTTGTVAYDTGATLQYNTTTATTVSTEEFIASIPNLIISNTGVITTHTTTTTVTGALTIDSGSSLTLAGIIFTVNGTTNITGTLNESSATGLKRFDGMVTVNSGGTFSLTTTDPAVEFRGGITNNGGTANTGNGATTFNGNQVFAGSSGITIGSATAAIISTGSTLTNNNNGTVIFLGGLNGFDSSSSYATGSGSSTRFDASSMTTGTLVPSTSVNTIRYNYANPTCTTPSTNPYYHLGFTGSTGTVACTVTNITGNFVLETSTMSFTMPGNLTIGGILSLGNNTTFITGSELLTLSSAGTPISGGGTFTTTGGTVLFTGDGATIPAKTYNHLRLEPSGGTKQILSAGTFTVNGNLTIGNGENEGADADTNDPTINVTGNVSISSGATFTSTSGTLTIGGNFTDVGTFTHSSGTVVFDTASAAEIDGNSTIFWNFSVTTAGKTIKFKQGETVRFNGLLTLTGADGNNVVLNNIDGSTTDWTIYHSDSPEATESVNYVTVNNSACHANSSVITNTNTTDGGNNGTTTCWGFVVGLTVSGTVYQTDEVTTLSAKTVHLRKNGTLTGTGSGGTGIEDSDGSGNFSFIGLSASAGDTFTLYLDGETEDANTITITDGSTNITSLPLYDDHVVIRSDNSSTAITILDILDYDNDQNSTEMLFDAEDASPDTLVLENGVELHIYTGDTFTPGGTVTTDPSSDGTDSNVDGDVHIDGTGVLSMGTNNLSIGGDLNNEGTFSYSGGQVTTFTATATGHTIEENTSNFDTLTMNGSSGGWTLSSALTLAGALTITAGNLTVGATDLSVGGATSITGTLTISSSTGTKSFTGNVTVNASGTWNNSGNEDIALAGSLTNNQTFTAGSGVYTMSGTSKTIAGTIAIPSLTISGTTQNDGTLTVSTTLSGASTLTQGVTGTLNIGGTSAITGLTATADGNVVNYTGAAQTCKATTYDTVNFTGSGSASCAMTTVENDMSLSGTVNLSTGANLAIGDDLNIGSGTTFTQGAFSLTISGDVDTSGAYVASSGALTFKGNLTRNSGSTWTKSSGLVTFQKSGGGTSVYTMSGTASTGIGDTTIAADGINNTTLQLAGSSAANFDTLTINANQTLDQNGVIIGVLDTGTTFVNNGTFTPSGTFIYTVTANSLSQNVAATTYDSLVLGFNGLSSTVVLPASNITLRGNLAIVSTYAVTKGAGTIIFAKGGGGTQTITDATSAGQDLGALRVSANSGVTTLSSASSFKATSIVVDDSQVLDITSDTLKLTGSGTPLTLGSGATFTSTGSSVQYIGNSATDVAATTYNLLAVGTSTAAVTYTLAGDTTVGSILTIGVEADTSNKDVLNLSTRTLTLSAGSGAMPLLISAGGTFTPSNSTVVYTGNSSYVASTTFNNLTLGGTGTYTMPASTVTLRGNLSIPSGATVTKGAGTIVFARGAGETQTWTDSNGTSQDIGAVQVTANSGVTTLSTSSNVKATSVTVDTSQIFSIDSDTLILTGDSPLSVSGTFTSTGSTVQFTGTTVSVPALTYKNLTLGGVGTYTLPGSTLTIHGNLIVTSGATVTKGAGTLVFGGQTIQSWTDNTSGQDIGSVQISGTGGNPTTLTLGSSVRGTKLTVDNDQGFTTNGSNTLTLTGASMTPLVIGTGATFTTSSGSTIDFIGNGSNTIIPARSYYNLGLKPLEAGQGTFFQVLGSGTFDISGNLTVGDGVSGGASASSNNPVINVAGTLAIATGATFTSTSNNLTIGNDFTNNGGFTHNSGTVIFNTSTQSDIGGSSSTTFNNFSVSGINATKKITFKHHTANSPIYSFAGTFTLTGSIDYLLTLTSDNSSDQWLADFASAQPSSVTFTRIGYSGCSNSADVTLDSTSIDDTHNDSCWVFPNVQQGGGAGGYGTISGQESGVGSQESGGGAGGSGGGSTGEGSGSGGQQGGGGSGGGGGGDLGYIRILKTIFTFSIPSFGFLMLSEAPTF